MASNKVFRRRSGTHDWVQVTLAGIFILVFAVIVIGVYWAVFDDNPPATVNNVHLHSQEGIDEIVDTAVVVPGGNLYFGMDYCKFTDSPVTFRRTWKNELLFISPLVFPSVFPRGCRHVDAAVLVPQTLPTGEYVLDYTIEFPINPLRERSVKFEVGLIKVQILP